MVKDIVIKETDINDFGKRRVLGTILPAPRIPLPTQEMKMILEYLPAITEFYKEWREGRKIELNHERAMHEIEAEDKRWEAVMQERATERQKIQESMNKAVEEAEGISEKHEIYRLWVELLKLPMVLPQEVNLKKGGDER